jgi:DNA polymerase-3 subunit epsilon
VENFAAIDFETANNNHSSVCAVGIVVVHKSEITEKFYSLIQPIPNWYEPWFTSKIHGLSKLDTDRARKFPEVWAEIEPKIAGLPLVAHNSSFDEDCLCSVFKAYNIKYPEYKFYCTCNASRRTFKLPNHKLDTVSMHCGFNLTNHHNALADAEACAWIAKQIL